MCTVHESKKKKLFYSSHQLKNHFFLSLTLCLCLSPKSLSSHSLSVCVSLSLPNHSSSPKTPIIKLSSFWPSRPKAPNHSPSLLSHHHAFSSRLSLLCWLGLIVRWDWRGLIVSWLCSGGFLWLYSGGFRGCAVGLLQTKEKKSPERKRRTNREMNNKKN